MAEDWKTQPLGALCVESIDENTAEWLRRLNYCQKNVLMRTFEGPMQYCAYIIRQVENLKRYIPLLLALKTRGMQQTHFNMINK